ncbi:MAG: response regulator [Chloroflexi bacterium]|nr:response regulator [Chloroflexota bacterium]MBV9895001.1 response regulator [Chloroflexota bacterium]
MEHAPRLDRTALVVDDDKFIVSALAELLEDDGFDVYTATNGFSALRQAAELKPSVVLLDVALPERSGGQILEDLRADPATHDVAIVVVTGHADLLSDAQLAETDGVIGKPFDAVELLEMVQFAIQRAAARRAEVAPAVVGLGHREASLRARRPSPSRVPRRRR